ncbi:MAG: hypothetical protein EU541_05055 [Promethearchaeota archaeon]|nr:MAG: hypothetical protein EU541_05055 [Candidatus Lokiarchaeota archaeon]
MEIVAFYMLFMNSVILVMTFYAIWKWSKQKELHFYDINLLFGFFFLFLFLGKSIRTLYILIYFTTCLPNLLIILKLRYMLIILTGTPLIYLGLNAITHSKSNSNKIRNKNDKLILNSIILLITVTFQSIVVLTAPDLSFMNIILLLIHIPSLIWISGTFYYAFKKGKCTEIKPQIISLAFLIDLILFISSSFIILPNRSSSGFSPFYIIFTELIDLMIIIIIFLGYFLESKYSIQNN